VKESVRQWLPYSCIKSGYPFKGSNSSSSKSKKTNRFVEDYYQGATWWNATTNPDGIEET
jgi:hypothetical protein